MATTTEELGRVLEGRPPDGSIRSLIPARLDRLGWSRFHTHLVIALGVAWVLDGLEITIASNAEGLISQKQALNLSSSEVAFAVGTVYLLGEVVGALFGRMSDKFGRRNLFMITLGVYLFGGVLTALTSGHSHGWTYWVWASRFIAGMGIGGEYTAINSAIDELIPAKYRGRVDIAVERDVLGGALIATLFFIFVINLSSVSYSWRIAFLVGPALGFVILFVRKNLPESPRWLLMHGRVEEPKPQSRNRETHRTRWRHPRPIRRIQGDRDHPGQQHRLRGADSNAVRLYPRRGHPRGVLDDHAVVPLQRHLLHVRIGAPPSYNVPATDTAYYFIFFALGTRSARSPSGTCSTRSADGR